MIQKIKQQWFLLGLILVSFSVILDSSNTLSDIGIRLKNNSGPEIMICLIFFISGLMIEVYQIQAGIKDTKATLLALIVIVVFSPLVAMLFTVFPLETGALIGLFIVAVMPTTLSSGVVMTRAAGGNMAHALFVTISSNFLGIFTIPFILSFLLSFLDQGKELVIDQKAIMMKLILLVLLPFIIGICMKIVINKRQQLNTNKLQLINQLMIISIVFMSLSGAKQVLLAYKMMFIPILVLVTVFHVVLLCVSFALTNIFTIGKGRYESIIFMGSQKTLPLSVMIQVTYFNEFGMALLVCVLHHIVHLMIDGYLSAKMGKEEDK